MFGELGGEFGDVFGGAGGEALSGDADGEGEVAAEVGEVAGGLGFLCDAVQADDAGEEFDGFFAAEQAEFGAVDGFQAGEGVAAGDEGEGGALPGQQGPYLVLVRGVVQHEQDAPVAQEGAQETAAVVGAGGYVGGAEGA